MHIKPSHQLLYHRPTISFLPSPVSPPSSYLVQVFFALLIFTTCALGSRQPSYTLPAPVGVSFFGSSIVSSYLHTFNSSASTFIKSRSHSDLNTSSARPSHLIVTGGDAFGNLDVAYFYEYNGKAVVPSSQLGLLPIVAPANGGLARMTLSSQPLSRAELSFLS